MSGFCSDSFQHRSLMADYYTFLTVSCNMNERPDSDNVLFFCKTFNLNLNRIRYLFFIIKEDLFANYLRCKKPFIFISKLIFRENMARFRKFVENCIQKRIEIKFLSAEMG